MSRCWRSFPLPPPESLAIAGFAVAVPLLVVAGATGRRLGLLDHPGGIKPHARAVPYTGGAALAATLALVGAVAGLPPAILGGALLMWAAGAIDDIRGLPAIAKLAAELPALAVAAFALGLDPPSAIAAIGLGLVLVNGFNVVDGLDGLAAGVALPSLTILAFAPGWGGAAAAIVAGATCAFLLFNLPPARMFLGDEGSLLLGYVLWAIPLAVLRSDGAVPGWLPWVLLWAFPILNAAYVVAVRVRARRSVLRGDRAHLYDLLNGRLGLGRTLLICWTLAALGAAGTLAL